MGYLPQGLGLTGMNPLGAQFPAAGALQGQIPMLGVGSLSAATAGTGQTRTGRTPTSSATPVSVALNTPGNSSDISDVSVSDNDQGDEGETEESLTGSEEGVPLRPPGGGAESTPSTSRMSAKRGSLPSHTRTHCRQSYPTSLPMYFNGCQKT